MERIQATLADILGDAKAIISIRVTKQSNQLAALEPVAKVISEYLADLVNPMCPRAELEPEMFMVIYRMRSKSFTVSLPAMLQAAVVNEGDFRVDHMGTAFGLSPEAEEAPETQGRGNSVATIYWATLATGIKELAPIAAIRDATEYALGQAGFRLKEGKQGFNTITKDGMLTNRYALNFEAPSEDDIENMVRYARTVRQINIGNNAADFYLNRELCQAWNICQKCYKPRGMPCGCVTERPRVAGYKRRASPAARTGAKFSKDLDF